MPIFLLAFLIGALSAFGFQPYAVWPLTPLGFAGLLELLKRTNSLKAALGLGWAFGLGQFTVGLNWIATAFSYQAAMPAWLGWVAVVLLSLYLAVYPALASGLAWRLGGGRPFAMVLALAGAWAVGEWLRAGIFTGFPWNPAGVSLVDTIWLRPVTFLGSYGLSALTVLLGGSAWLLCRLRWKQAGDIFIFLVLLAIVPILPLETRPERPVRVVQPNIGQEDKWRENFAGEAERRLATLSGPPSATPRLLLWPEAAITDPLQDARTGEHRAFAEFERTRASEILGPDDLLLTGGIAIFSRDGKRIDGAANSVFMIAPGGRVAGRYDKAHLVPYGEYLPMRPLLSAIGLSRLAPGDIDFDPGPGPRTVDLGPLWGKAGFQICYEIIFSGEVVDQDDRPDFIFNPSNDAWFGRWGPPQHLAQARLRAAEEGLPVIRATPTGISAIVDSRGQLLGRLPWRRAGVIDGAVPMPLHDLTLFARFGNWLPMLFAAALMICAIVLGRTRRYSAGT